MKSNKPSKPPGIYENGRFPGLIDLTNVENAVFLHKSTQQNILPRRFRGIH